MTAAVAIAAAAAAAAAIAGYLGTEPPVTMPVMLRLVMQQSEDCSCYY